MPWWKTDCWTRCAWVGKTGRCSRVATVCFTEYDGGVCWGRCTHHDRIEYKRECGAVTRTLAVVEVAQRVEEMEAQAALRALAGDGGHFDRVEFERGFRRAKFRRSGVK